MQTQMIIQDTMNQMLAELHKLKVYVHKAIGSGSASRTSSGGSYAPSPTAAQQAASEQAASEQPPARAAPKTTAGAVMAGSFLLEDSIGQPGFIP